MAALVWLSLTFAGIAAVVALRLWTKCITVKGWRLAAQLTGLVWLCAILFFYIAMATIGQRSQLVDIGPLYSLWIAIALFQLIGIGLWLWLGRWYASATASAVQWERRIRWLCMAAIPLGVCLHLVFLNRAAAHGDAAVSMQLQVSRMRLDAVAPVVSPLPSGQPAFDILHGCHNLMTQPQSADPAALDLAFAVALYNNAFVTSRQSARSTRLPLPGGESQADEAQRGPTYAEFIAAHPTLRAEALAVTRRPIWRLGEPPWLNKVVAEEPGAASVLYVGHLLAADAYYASDIHDCQRAIEDLEALDLLADRVGMAREGFFGYLLALSLREMAWNAAEPLLALPDLQAEPLRNWKIGGEFSVLTLYRHNLIAEEAYAMQAIDLMKTRNVAELAGRSAQNSDFHLLGYGDLIARAYALPKLAKDYADRSAWLQVAAAGPLSNMVGPNAPDLNPPQDANLLIRLVGGATAELPKAAANCDVLAELVCLARAATLYKLDQGVYPSTLADLVPTYLAVVPEDPFSGQPIQMRSVDGGLVLWSVGEDGRDGHGERAVDSKGQQRSPWEWNLDDLTFYVGPAHYADLEAFRRAVVRDKAPVAPAPEP